jgi:hypothetical protein
MLSQAENLELKICAIDLHSSLTAMNGVFSRGTDKTPLIVFQTISGSTSRLQTYCPVI